MARSARRTIESPDMPNTMIDQVCATLSENAARVDAESAWPEASIRAIADAGLLTAPGTMREFADTVRRLSQACSSTAMIYLMHVCAIQVIAASPNKQLAGKIGS